MCFANSINTNDERNYPAMNYPRPPLSTDVPAVLFLERQCAELTAEFLCEEALWNANPNRDTDKLSALHDALKILLAELQNLKLSYAKIYGETNEAD